MGPNCNSVSWPCLLELEGNNFVSLFNLMKKCLWADQRSAVPWNQLSERASGWLPSFFHFGTEQGRASWKISLYTITASWLSLPSVKILVLAPLWFCWIRSPFPLFTFALGSTWCDWRLVFASSSLPSSSTSPSSPSCILNKLPAVHRGNMVGHWLLIMRCYTPTTTNTYASSPHNHQSYDYYKPSKSKSSFE